MLTKKIPFLFALFLTSSSLFGFTLNLKTLEGRSYTLEIDETVKTVLDLKKKIQELTEKDPEVQRLVFKGKQLGNDEQSLEDAGITEDGSTLLLVQRFTDG